MPPVTSLERGVVLALDTEIDLTGMSAAALVIRAPDGTSLTRTLDEPGDPAAGIFSYSTVDADFPVGGPYDLEVRVDFGASKRLRGQNDLPVRRSLEE